MSAPLPAAGCLDRESPVVEINMAKAQFLNFRPSHARVDGEHKRQVGDFPLLPRSRRFFEQLLLILISHRVSTVQHADQIVVLRDGRIVERGTHAELLERGGYYADLYQKQLLEEELERE